jgi:hypothetical protein
MLLAAAWKRLLAAGMAVAVIWAAVLWVARSTPSTAPAQPSVSVAAQVTSTPSAQSGTVQRVIESGSPAPGGGYFDRFDVPSQPVVAPINSRCQVAFYATVLRAPAREGIFLAELGRVVKVAAFGDSLPGGGTLAEFAEHPLPLLNEAGHVAFGAGIAGGRATEGIFFVGDKGLLPVALTGDDAPGIPGAVITALNTPTLNDNDELAFVATVRRGRDTLDVLYFWNGRRLQRVIAEGERLLRVGGAIDKIGEPTLNNSGVIAFPAAILKGPVLGGIFVAGARDLRLLVAAGAQTPNGQMIQRFSEHVAIDDDDEIAFGAYLGQSGNTHEAVLRFTAEGLTEIAVEGGAAPGGGRYAGFGPWPTVGPGRITAFIAALDSAVGPLGVFSGTTGDLKRVAVVGENLSQDEVLGRFALNAVAAAGPAGAVTFATIGQERGGRTAIYRRCPVSAR